MSQRKRIRNFQEYQNDANRPSTSTSSDSHDQLPERSSRKRKFNYADRNDDYSDIGDFSDSGSYWEPNSDEYSYVSNDDRSFNIKNGIMNVSIITGVETIGTSVQNAEVSEELENQSSIIQANISDLSVDGDGDSIGTSTTNLPNGVNSSNINNTLIEVNTSNIENRLIDVNTRYEDVNGKYFCLSRIHFLFFIFRIRFIMSGLIP